VLIPSRLTRYVLSELRHPTLLAIGLWSFLLLMNQFFLIAKEAIAKDLPLETVFRMIVYFLPNALILAIPMGTLLGTMIAVGRLSADHEWVALQSAGLGPRFLLRPVVVHGILMTAVALVVYGIAQPAASYALRVLSGEILATSSIAADLRPRVFYDDLPGAVLFVNEIRPGGGGRLDGALLYQPGQANRSYEQLVLAKEAFLYQAPGRKGALEIDLREGVSHSYRSDSPESYRTYLFRRYVPALLESPSYLRALERPPDRTVQNMSPRELIQEVRVAKLEKDPVIRPFRIRNAQVELQQRIALPFACLLFAVLAMPLGMTRVRTGKGAGFALSLLVILVYWVIFTSARDQASLRGTVPAWLGVWSGNLVMVVWAVYAHWRLRRPQQDEPGRLSRILSTGISWGPALLARWSRDKRKTTRATPIDVEEAGDTTAASASGRFVTLLDQYVIKLYLRMFLLALASGYLIVSIVELKDLLDGVLQRGHSLTLLLRYYKYFVPGNAEIVVPIACLVGGIVSFTLLGRSGELTAMKAGGISMLRAAAPVIGVTMLLCGVFYLVQDRIAPVTNRKALELKDRILDRAPRTYGMPQGGRWTFGTEGRLYHYRLYDPAEQRFQGLSVYTVDLKTPRILDHRFSATARWNGKQSKWILEKGWYRSFPPDSRVVDYRLFEGPESVQLDPPENFAQREMTLTRAGDFPEQMSRGALGRQIEALRNSGFDTTRLTVAYYAKVSRPLTPLVMVLLGLPFAFKIGRHGSLYAVGVALVLVIVYWATFALFHAMGLETLLPPILAAWAPNVLYALLGTYLMLYIKT
jgi:LPS export ABC transporter permease LptG/LPS export ABC transporter permease LptF